MARLVGAKRTRTVKIVSARDAKNGFGRLIDLARAEPVAVAKHGRVVVVVMAVEEFERMKGLAKKSSSESAARLPRPV
jgi:prevent-host-death family protein